MGYSRIFIIYRLLAFYRFKPIINKPLHEKLFNA